LTSPFYSKLQKHLTYLVPAQDKSSLPVPNAERVLVTERPSGDYAALTFSGVADPEAAAQKQQELRALMQRRKISAAGDEWFLARYNDPSTKPMFRKNEVLIPVRDFDLWES
jgi:hypothetical protein